MIGPDDPRAAQLRQCWGRYVAAHAAFERCAAEVGALCAQEAWRSGLHARLCHAHRERDSAFWRWDALVCELAEL